MKYFSLGLGLCMILCWACNGGETVEVSDVPVLRVESVSPMTVKQFEEPIILTLYYEDRNGDLGSEDPDEQVLSVKDSRLSEADYYHVKPIAPIGSNVPIQGTLEVNINTLFLLGNGDSESVTFTVSIVDRAGNWSPVATSPTVTVTR